jgi:hypothetical protein
MMYLESNGWKGMPATADIFKMENWLVCWKFFISIANYYYHFLIKTNFILFSYTSLLS